MILSDLLYRVSIVSVKGDTSISIKEVNIDSRKVQKEDLFVALKGWSVDGHEFIESAINSGARAVVCEKMPTVLNDDVSYIQVAHSSEALGIIASNFYGNPSRELTLVGVTGTNGKTTVATLLFDLYRSMGYESGLISTINNFIGEKALPSTHTTPDALSIHALMRKMVDAGVSHCFMEVSSHALDQRRTFGLQFNAAIFTNISRDHLDYHETFEKYIEAKKLLFDHLGSDSIALVNADDRRAKIMLQNCKGNKNTFGIKTVADFKARLTGNTFDGLEMDVDGKQVWFRLVGGFNAYNLLAVYGTAVKLGEDPDEVLTMLSTLKGATGRFDKLQGPEGIVGIIDYAHTPDALENVLNTISDVRTGNEQVITVVGCGGNRDKGKRPIMAAIACELSDKVIVTSDNPRYEDPSQIMQDMIKELDPVQMRKVLRIVDREEAIRTAAMLAQKGDIILIAGKGHETYQEIKGDRYPFDDREVLSRMFNINTN